MKTTMAISKFKRELTKAKRAADKGPVLITDRGQLTHVFATLEDYRSGYREPITLIDVLAHTNPDVADIELELPERKIESERDINFP